MKSPTPTIIALILGLLPSGRELPAQSFHSGYAAMEDGTRIYYEIYGEGEQVVVVPMAMYLAEALSPLAEGRRIVFYDPRNRGRSDAADLATVSLDRQVRDLEALRAALRIEEMALIGWSGLGDGGLRDSPPRARDAARPGVARRADGGDDGVHRRQALRPRGPGRGRSGRQPRRGGGDRFRGALPATPRADRKSELRGPGP